MVVAHDEAHDCPARRETPVAAPLDDIVVIEIDSWMAAPSAGAILADLGADVIKVEPLTGDPMRDLGRPAKIDGPLKGYDFQFDVDNRGKRSSPSPSTPTTEPTSCAGCAARPTCSCAT
jgi:hypothetical protein